MSVPLQNRVDPFGEIRTAAGRGLFTGNRGVIHDPDTKTLRRRRWTTRAWLVCECEFKGRRRDVMGRNGRSGGAGWTELFFLDEVTALAAGHRPCFHCRRERALEFAAACSAAFPQAHPTAPLMDEKLHRQRLASGGTAAPVEARALARLPDGVMLARGRQPVALRGGRLLAWTFDGYGDAERTAHGDDEELRLLTPPLTVTALGAGYVPAWHHSANGAP